MNWMSAAVLVILLFSLMLGVRKGLLRQALSLFGALICLWLVSLLLPYTQDFIRNHTAIEQTVSDRIDQMIEERIEGAITAADLPSLSEEQKQSARNQALQELLGSKSKQNDLISAVELPEFLKKRLVENNNSEIYNRLGVEKFTDYVKAYLADLIIKVVAYVVSFVLAFVIFRLILFAAHIVDHLPLARGLNRGLGGLFGLAQGLVLLGVFFVLLIPLCTTAFGKACFTAIEDSTLLTYLYQHNPIMAVVTAFTG